VRNIIIDTDIGDDIDDALALALAVSVEALNVCGVVTVFQDVQTRARIAAKLLAAAGQSGIPIAEGLGDPLIHRPARNCWIDWQSRGLSASDSVAAIRPIPGPSFIAEVVLASSEPVTLVGIGPLTNIASTLTLHPAVKERVDEIVIMGGCFAENHAEWNMSLDPEAARIVYESGLPMRVIPLDVTRECLMTESQLQEVAASERPVLRYLAELIAGWNERTGEKYPVLHDPLAIGCLAAPELYRFQRSAVTVDLHPGKRYGLTRAVPDESSHVQICDSVDYDAFSEFFGSQLMGSSSTVQA
jgi:purine nucleosidase/pyrimidine-specific ribonucleoside hydrolase